MRDLHRFIHRETREALEGSLQLDSLLEEVGQLMDVIIAERDLGLLALQPIANPPLRLSDIMLKFSTLSDLVSKEEPLIELLVRLF